jgi:chromosome segregation ATPase
MLRMLLLTASLLQIGTSAFCQTSLTDSQVLQSLLAEVRQLRQDLQATTAAAQRVQIVLYRLQIQGIAVGRATTILEEARSKVTNAESARRRSAAELQNLEEVQRQNPDANVHKAVDGKLPELRRVVEMWTADLPQLQAKESEALGQLQAEQAKMNELQDSLDRYDKALANFSRKSAGGPN